MLRLILQLRKVDLQAQQLRMRLQSVVLLMQTEFLQLRLVRMRMFNVNRVSPLVMGQLLLQTVTKGLHSVQQHPQMQEILLQLVLWLMQKQMHLLRLVEKLLLSVKKVLQLVKILLLNVKKVSQLVKTQRLPKTVLRLLQSVFHQLQIIQTQQRSVLMQEVAMLIAWH